MKFTDAGGTNFQLDSACDHFQWLNAIWISICFFFSTSNNVYKTNVSFFLWSLSNILLQIAHDSVRMLISYGKNKKFFYRRKSIGKSENCWRSQKMEEKRIKIRKKHELVLVVLLGSSIRLKRSPHAQDAIKSNGFEYECTILRCPTHTLARRRALLLFSSDRYAYALIVSNFFHRKVVEKKNAIKFILKSTLKYQLVAHIQTNASHELMTDSAHTMYDLWVLGFRVLAFRFLFIIVIIISGVNGCLHRKEKRRPLLARKDRKIMSISCIFEPEFMFRSNANNNTTNRKTAFALLFL